MTESVSAQTTRPAEVTILVVCTANICRSPIAEGLLRKRLESAPNIVVSSGGFLPGGRPVDPFAVKTLAERNIQVAAARSRQLDPQLLRHADLIITMTNDHVRQAVDMAPHSWQRLFSIADLAGRMSAVGPRRGDEKISDYVGRLHAGRTAAAAMAAGTTGDIADPFGESLSAFERTAAQLDRYCALVASSIMGVAVTEFRGQTGISNSQASTANQPITTNHQPPVPASSRRAGIFRRRTP